MREIQCLETGLEPAKDMQRTSFTMKIRAVRVTPVCNPSGATLIAAVALSLTSCTSLPHSDQSETPAHLGSHGLGIATDVDTCRDTLGQSEPDTATELDAGNISLLSWNIQKGSARQLSNDLVAVAAGRDLLLIQEAIVGPELADSILDMSHWAFAPGYRSGNQLSGVMTFSSSPPLTHCNLTNKEPWLQTPKATAVTEYGLKGTHQTLVVVNIHAINFSLGVEDFQRQMDQVGQVLQTHPGPVILSGDFNTWRPARQAIVEALAEELDLTAVVFEEDHRTRFFGQTLDHLYVRGLTQSASSTHQLESSDHNPLAAELHF